jgi:cytokinin riboside 5'-monophosphate phosphoribohydrolase
LLKSLCVFCSSSDAVHQVHFEVAKELGLEFCKRKITLIYGGATIGLMGTVARAVKENGGKVIGVIPESLSTKEVAYHAADELIITKDLRERKAIMDERADGFIALPGGFGTLEETIEVLTLKQLQLHTKPIIFLNTLGFYDPLINLFEHIYQEKFAKPESRDLYYIAPDVKSIFTYLDNYKTKPIQSKWF